MKKFFKRYSLSLLLLLLPSVFSLAQIKVPFTMDESTFYGDYVTTNAKKGIYLWENGKIRMTSDGVLDAGCGFCWDNRYFTVEISGAPDRVSFSTSTSALATSFDEISWLLEESTDGSSWESIWKSGKQTNTVSVELNKKSRFIRLHYGFNYSGYVKDFSVSACHYVKFMDGEREIASFGPFRKDESLASISAPLVADDECMEFVGWDAKLPAKMSSSDIVLHSVFNKKTFSATLRFSDETEEIDLPDDTLTVTCGEPVAVTQPSLAGFSFKGWFPALPLITSKEVDGAIYQALWSRNKYKLYYLNGNDTVSSLVEYGKAPSPIADPTKKGYSFLSWTPDVPSLMPAHDVELTPLWKVNGYLLSAKIYQDSVWTDSLNYGDQLILPTPSRKGYRFAGWSNHPEYMPDYDVELSAQWIPVTYRLSVVGNGDTLLSRDYLYRDIVDKLPDFQLDGYTFLGFTSDVPVSMPDSDVVLTAVFQANKHLLRVVVDGDTIASDTFPYGASLSMNDYLPLPDEGYLFQWISDTISSMPDYDVTLSGTFVRQQYELRISDDDSLYLDTLYLFGDSIKLVAPIKHGYRLTNWTDLPSVMPAHPVDFSLEWSHETHWLSLSIETTEFFSASYFYGDTITYPSFPDSTNYRLYWSVDLPVVMPDSDLSVSGEWNLYKFRFLADYGIGSSVSDYYQSGDSIRSVMVPEREGFSFDGWSPEIPELMPDSDFTTKAQWLKNSYRLLVKIEDSVWVDSLIAYEEPIVLNSLPSRVGYSLRGDDAPRVMPADSVVLNYSWTLNIHRLTAQNADELLMDTLVEYGSPIELPTPSLAGYSFLEWSPALPSVMPDSDLHVSPLWVANQYGFTVLLDGEIVLDTLYAYGDTLRLPHFSDREGHSLVWESTLPSVMPADSLSLSARWILNEHRLVLMDGDSLLCDKMIPYGSNLQVEDLSKDGWLFDGWMPMLPALMPDSDVVSIALWRLPVYNLSVVDGVDTLSSEFYHAGEKILTPSIASRKGFSFEWVDTLPALMPEEDLSIRCRYVPNFYSFVLVVDSDTMVKARYAYDDDIEAFDYVPSKKGHTFYGWSDTIPARMPANDLTLSAEWIVNQYSYNVMDGDALLLDTLYEYGAAIAELPELKREGYRFMGWDTSYAEMPDYPVAIYARWEPLQYSITLMMVSLKSDVMLGLPTKIKFNYGEEINIPEPAYDGYHFAGWKNECPDLMPARNFALLALMEHDADPTKVENVTHEECPFYLLGKTIRFAHMSKTGRSILLDMNGRVLYDGNSDQIEAPCSGRYVLVVDGSVYDLVIK